MLHRENHWAGDCFEEILENFHFLRFSYLHVHVCGGHAWGRIKHSTTELQQQL